jgi:DNA-binding MarR family transcriptional regulator
MTADRPGRGGAAGPGAAQAPAPGAAAVPEAGPGVRPAGGQDAAPAAGSVAGPDAGLEQHAADLTDAVMAASRLLVGISARALAEVEPCLTLPQLRALVVLDGQGPITLTALAGALGVNPSTALRMVDRLVTAGSVHREVNPGNRREVLLRLTPAGARLVGHVLQHRQAEIARIAARLPADHRAVLVTALREFLAAADELD